MNIVVVGSGPGGIAAAVTASEQGAKVFLLDENPRAGGQIWRHQDLQSVPYSARRWMQRLRSQSIEAHFGTTALGWNGTHVQGLRNESEFVQFPYDKIILATGARELLLPFPGWTLPNVLGCGGAQALLKAGLPVKGKRVVVSGSGPLLLAVAAAFIKKGAKVVGIFEQAEMISLGRFGARLALHPHKLWQGLVYGWRCFPTLMKPGSWIQQAEGDQALRSVTVTNGKREWKLECDLLACGYGLVPNTELASSMGCKIDKDRIQTDREQKTSLTNIYCVGEGTGIGGEDVALLEGQIAALSALGRKEARIPMQTRLGWEPFQQDLDQCFRLRKEVLHLARHDTIVCRCEDISFATIENFPDQRSAKLQTRCGMGPCQGRVCGAACKAIFGWEPNKSRTPLVPMQVDTYSRYLAGK